MNKLFTKGRLIVYGTMLLLVVVSIAIKSCTADMPIRASISPLNVEVGTPIHYVDSTYNTSHILWEFGNGDISNDKSGFYTFNEIGRYQVRLIVNRAKSQCFIVNVRERRSDRNDKMVKI